MKYVPVNQTYYEPYYNELVFRTPAEFNLLFFLSGAWRR